MLALTRGVTYLLLVMAPFAMWVWQVGAHYFERGSATMADIINYYDALGIDRNLTTQDILKNLDTLVISWAAKAARAGSRSEDARNMIALAEQAQIVFKDDESREQYDLSLRKAGTPTETEEATVDWTIKAWNYYMQGDNGAAMVACRKAKEQSPNDPMTFVVSAWVKLNEMDQLRQAKDDADEAFVLDELSADTTDVHHVRGYVYYLLGPDNDDRAIQSYDRALAVASPNEKPEILLRKSWVYARKNSNSQAYDCAMEALTSGAVLSAPAHAHAQTIEVGEALVKVVSDAINNMCNGGNAQESLRQYSDYSAKITSSQMPSELKTRIIDNINANIQRCQNLQKARDTVDRLDKEIRDLEAINDVSGPLPDIPLIPIVAAVVCFFIMIGCFSASAGAGVFFLLVTAAIGAYVGVKINKRNQWRAGRARFEAAQQRLGAARSERGRAQSSIPPLTKAILINIRDMK